MATIILGSQWGDEGKGKLTDNLLATNAFNICARAAGGHNAGHSINFHLLPSGLISPATDNLIGSSVVFNIDAFFKELSALEAKGVPRVHERIHVSSRCHLNFDLHAAVDGLSEVELGSEQIGTTKRTKAARDGLRVIDLYSDSFERKLRQLAEGYRQRYGDLLKYDVDAELRKCNECKEKLRPYIVDAVEYMRVAEEKKKTVLVEGSQALMLDIDYGTYPYVTSSNTGLGGCIQGLTLSPFYLKNIIAVVKAYTTRVGGGPFPTEQLNEIGTKLQDIGGEIGVSTGRRRRCGWLDLVVLKYSTAVNHYTAINLTKLDVLDTFPVIRVATAYIAPDGKRVTTFPADLNELETYEVEYTDVEGWQTSTEGVRSWEGLPPQAQKYVALIEEYVGVKVTWVGTGRDREDMIVRA
ncbi:adenylosuccinate synthetase [Niveomyces insectorum RCEF 264]|uniref:Adenylosuccinate synthetase n=1 Tax=Niveomyces insectorum RCEF 264 TaxID=1081102 RepID=A0A162J9G4_9HYPO|nr:adenylosuccinate synthetase [Niveomyces insectorum RCEF 264]